LYKQAMYVIESVQ